MSWWPWETQLREIRPVAKSSTGQKMSAEAISCDLDDSCVVEGELGGQPIQRKPAGVGGIVASGHRPFAGADIDQKRGRTAPRALRVARIALPSLEDPEWHEEGRRDREARLLGDLANASVDVRLARAPSAPSRCAARDEAARQRPLARLGGRVEISEDSSTYFTPIRA